MDNNYKVTDHSNILAQYYERLNWRHVTLQADIEYLERLLLKVQDESEKKLINDLYVKLNIIQEAYKQAVSLIKPT